MVLEIWKKRGWRRTPRWGFFCLFCLLCLRCLDLGAVEVMETGQGKVLIGSSQQESGVAGRTDSGSRDPFNWSAEFIKQDLFVELQLSGIVWNPQHPLAIINKAILKEGEMVENVTILKISKDSVLVAGNGALHTLYFQQRIIDLGSESAGKDKGSEERK